MYITLHGSSARMRVLFHLHVIHDERLIVRFLSVSSCLSFSCFSLLFTSSLPHSTCTLTSTPSMTRAPRETTAAPSPTEEYCTLAIYHPPTWNNPVRAVGQCATKICVERSECELVDAVLGVGDPDSPMCLTRY